MIVVAGGGPAGAAAACWLARQGRAVTVIERDAAPAHKVCGEFLSGEALTALAELGVDVAALGGVVIDRVRLLRGARCVEAALPFAAAGLSRRVLDAALLDAARRAGAEVLRGCAVRSVAAGAVEVDGAGTLPAEAVLLATGKHDLRGLRRPPARNTLVGFKTHARLRQAEMRALSGAVELMLFRDAYVGLQMVGAQNANLCLLAEAERLQRCGGWDGLLAGLQAESPHLSRRLRDAVLWPKPLAIAGVPYGFVHRPSRDDAVFRVGDQAGVIASFTGDGMAIALHTARLAARCIAEGSEAPAFHREAARGLRPPIRVAGAAYAGGRIPWVQAAMLAWAARFPSSLGALGRLTRIAA